MTTNTTPFEEEKDTEKVFLVNDWFNKLTPEQRAEVLASAMNCWDKDWEEDTNGKQSFVNIFNISVSSLLHQQREMMRKEREECIEILTYILKDINGYSPDGEIETLCWQAKEVLDILSNKECACACHENKLQKPYEHSGKCCERMNGFLDDKEIK